MSSYREKFISHPNTSDGAVESLEQLEALGYNITGFVEYKDGLNISNGFVMMLNSEKMSYVVMFLNGWVTYGLAWRGVSESILNFLETINGN